MSLPPTTSRFESAVLEHLDAAHNLARWLMRNEQDAQDVVQESCIRAMRAFDTERSGEFRPWFLTIVRNTSFTWLAKRKQPTSPGRLGTDVDVAADCSAFDPQALAIRAADVGMVRRAVDQLPEIWREVIVLREMEAMSYKEIGKITGVPIGTVMSRLARGRSRLKVILMEQEGQP